MYNENTTLFVRHANEIYARFNDWKSIDRFYFIPLELDMTYSIDGHRISMADGQLYLGTFVRTVLEHPELFQFKCPTCGKTVLPYRFCGSPLSGRVDVTSNFESTYFSKGKSTDFRNVKSTPSLKNEKASITL